MKTAVGMLGETVQKFIPSNLISGDTNRDRSIPGIKLSIKINTFSKANFKKKMQELSIGLNKIKIALIFLFMLFAHFLFLRKKTLIC